jgi:hypothetical protein
MRQRYLRPIVGIVSEKSGTFSREDMSWRMDAYAEV